MIKGMLFYFVKSNQILLCITGNWDDDNIHSMSAASAFTCAFASMLMLHVNVNAYRSGIRSLRVQVLCFNF